MMERRPLNVLMGVIGAGNGGMSGYMVALFKKMAQQDKTIRFTFLSTTAHPFFEQDILENGGSIAVIPSRMRHPLAHKKAVGKIIAEGSFDVCHIHLSTASNIDPLKIAVKMGVKKVFAHSHSAGAEGNKLAAVLHKLNVPALGRLPIERLACSRAAGKFCYGDAPFTYIPNGVDLSRFYWSGERRDTFREKYGIPSDAFVLGHIGRFVPVKNHAFLLELFAEVKKRRPNAMLLLCGDGPLLQPMQEKAASLGLLNAVVFTGNIKNPEDAYCAMDVMALPSFFEGFPLTVVEAYASGLPTLVSDTVTPEVGIGELVRFFSLSDEKGEIASRLLSMETVRTSRTEELTALGFDADGQTLSMLKRYHDPEV